MVRATAVKAVAEAARMKASGERVGEIIFFVVVLSCFADVFLFEDWLLLCFVAKGVEMRPRIDMYRESQGGRVTVRLLYSFCI